MKILLIFNFFIINKSDTQAARRNIHQQHTIIFAVNAFTAQSLPDRRILGINFLGHINNFYFQTSFDINLIQQKHLVQRFTHSGRCLHTAFFHTIFGHQAFVALQQFTDFADHTERDNFIFKSFFAQFDSVVALFDYFYLIHIAVFNYLHADHL